MANENDNESFAWVGRIEVESDTRNVKAENVEIVVVNVDDNDENIVSTRYVDKTVDNINSLTYDAIQNNRKEEVLFNVVETKVSWVRLKEDDNIVFIHKRVSDTNNKNDIIISSETAKSFDNGMVKIDVFVEKVVYYVYIYNVIDNIASLSQAKIKLQRVETFQVCLRSRVVRIVDSPLKENDSDMFFDIQKVADNNDTNIDTEESHENDKANVVDVDIGGATNR